MLTATLCAGFAVAGYAFGVWHGAEIRLRLATLKQHVSTEIAATEARLRIEIKTATAPLNKGR